MGRSFQADGTARAEAWRSAIAQKTHKALHGLAPANTSDQLSFTSACLLCSSHTVLLADPQTCQALLPLGLCVYLPFPLLRLFPSALHGCFPNSHTTFPERPPLTILSMTIASPPSPGSSLFYFPYFFF